MIITNTPQNIQFKGLKISEPAKIWMAKQISEMPETDLIYETLNYLKKKSGDLIDVNITDSFITTKFHREESIRVTLTPKNSRFSDKKYCIGTEKMYHNTLSVKQVLENTKKYLDKNLNQLKQFTNIENPDEKLPDNIVLIKNKISKYCD
ncbi:hypothetical protein IJZ97_02235 [bacterium]|nr:hypothetical protein [bacterium]